MYLLGECARSHQNLRLDTTVYVNMWLQLVWWGPSVWRGFGMALLLPPGLRLPYHLCAPPLRLVHTTV